jgi:hypothetical protein
LEEGRRDLRSEPAAIVSGRPSLEGWNGYELPPFELDGQVVRAWTTEVGSAKPGAPGKIRWQIGIEEVGSFISFEWHPSDTEAYVRQRVIAAARVHLRAKSLEDLLP